MRHAGSEQKTGPRRSAALFDTAVKNDSDYLFLSALFSILSPARSMSLPAPAMVLQPAVNMATAHKDANVKMTFFM
jgi:hypothetical protein